MKLSADGFELIPDVLDHVQCDTVTARLQESLGTVRRFAGDVGTAMVCGARRESQASRRAAPHVADGRGGGAMHIVR